MIIALQKIKYFIKSIWRNFIKFFHTLKVLKKTESSNLSSWGNLIFNENLQRSKLLLYVIVLFIVIFIVWASLATVDERVETQSAIVIPMSQVKEIQNLEGGIVTELFVKEGDRVKKGEKLVQMDTVQSKSALNEYQARYYAALARQDRLRAEVGNYDHIKFNKELLNYPDLMKNERELFLSNKRELKANTETLKAALEYVVKQIKIIEPLVKEKVIPRLTLIRLNVEANDIRGRIKATENNYYSKLRDELVKINVEERTLNSNLDRLRDLIVRSTVRSPVDGIVKELEIDTVGGVIKPGQEIMKIVPTDEQLLIEGKVAPSKIAFIHSGQSATVKITAYDPTIYGGLDAKVIRVSADAIIKPNARDDIESYYKVIVQTDRNSLQYREETLPIIPGMQATVSILTGRKTIMDYLLKPILKVKQNALHER